MFWYLCISTNILNAYHYIQFQSFLDKNLNEIIYKNDIKEADVKAQQMDKF